MSTKNACPKCEGTQGVEFKMWVEHTMFVDWNGGQECVDSGETREGLATCLDCGSKLRFSTVIAITGGLLKD